MFRAASLLTLLATVTACETRPATSFPGHVSFAIAPHLAAAEVAPAAMTPAATPPARERPPASPPPQPGGGGAIGGIGGFSGRVLDALSTSGSPIAGAEVRTADGRRAVTDALGRFSLPGAFPMEGLLVASRTGYVASAVAGLESGPLTLHLKPRVATKAQAATDEEAVRFVVRGRVVNSVGQAVPDVMVMLHDARGSVGVPTSTAADGTFELVVSAPGGKVEAGTVLAVGAAGQRWLGVATGLEATTANPELDFDPATPGVDPMKVLSADHPVTLQVDAGPWGARATVALEVVAPDGTSLSLPREGNQVWVADLPGVSYSLSGDAVDPERRTVGALRRQTVGIDFGASSSTIIEAFLAPPEVAPVAMLEQGARLAWAPVPEARGYTVSVAGLDGQGFQWEGFTSAAEIAFDHAGELSAGRYGITVTAIEADGLSPRTVAAVGARRLRVLPEGGDYRRASTQVLTTR